MRSFKKIAAYWVCVSGILFGQTAFAQIKGITDGPYVFYRQGKITVKSILVDAKQAQVLVDSFSITKPQTIQVHLDHHPDWDFSVALRKQIFVRPCIYTYTRGGRTLVLSDIEGEFEPFRNLLLAAKVIDTQYNWIFGKGRLIVAGDLFDRGKQVCQFLWLLYKLEDEAAKNGGDVNVVLGNHDIMNLSGDYRYVDAEYYENAKLINEHYSNLYAADTELGRWLRSKNTIEKIGDLLVLHGGISPVVLSRKLTVQTINNDCRPYYDARAQPIPDSLGDFFNDNALFWYRGYFIEPKATQGLVDSTLAFYGCKRIIVGHDIIDHIAPFYNNEVIGVDVNEHEGTHEALLIEKDRYYRIDDNGNKTLILEVGR